MLYFKNFLLKFYSSFIGCDLKFYLIDKYEQHLDEHTQDAGIEPEAKQLTLKDLKNYQKDLSNNKVGLFECLFCKFGTDQRSELTIY